MAENIVKDILKFGVQSNASDVHFSSNQQPLMRIMGELKKVDISPLDHSTLRQELVKLLDKRHHEIFSENHEVDFALTLPGISRLRINIYEHLDGIAGAFRVFPNEIRTLDSLSMPPVLKEMIKLKKGLILVTGPAGCGKSTTLAAMILEINRQQRHHIITIEDPIEYIHEPDQCLIHQREVRLHTGDYALALRNALREDPDIILVGEMRDLETMTHALRAAETGQLVFSTLHTNSAAESVDRIVNVFPAEQQQQIRVLIANTIVGVVSQRLLPMAFKQDRIALMEILRGTTAVRNLIREGKAYQIPSAIQTGSDMGMQTFEGAFNLLRKTNQVAPQLKLSDYL